MKLWNGNICLTNRICILVISGALFSTLLLANVWPDEVEPVEDGVEVEDTEESWIPTKEDIEYQDSMYAIIQNTQQDVDTIKDDINKILYKLERLDYKDGTHDSIRYVKGGKIDRKRN